MKQIFTVSQVPVYRLHGWKDRWIFIISQCSLSLFPSATLHRDKTEKKKKKHSDGRKIKDKWLWPSVWNMKSISFLPLSPALCREMLQRMETHPQTTLPSFESSRVSWKKWEEYYISTSPLTLLGIFFLRLNLWSHRSPWEPWKNWEHTFRLMLHSDPYSFKSQLFLN